MANNLTPYDEQLDYLHLTTVARSGEGARWTMFGRSEAPALANPIHIHTRAAHSMGSVKLRCERVGMLG